MTAPGTTAPTVATARGRARVRLSARVRARLRDRDTNGDAGFGLAELLVSMVVFAILLSVFMATIVAMNQSQIKTQGIADASAAGNKAAILLDKELRYADWVNTQSMGATGDWYIDFQTYSGSAVLTCYQWRVDTTGKLQQRTWLASSTATATSPSWQTIGSGVVYSATTSPFTVYGVVNQIQQVKVDLIFAQGSPAGRAETKLLISARNTLDTNAPVTAPATTPTVCQGVRS